MALDRVLLGTNASRHWSSRPGFSCDSSMSNAKTVDRRAWRWPIYMRRVK